MYRRCHGALGKSEDDLWESVLSFYPVDSGGLNSVGRPAVPVLALLYLAGPGGGFIHLILASETIHHVF